MNNFHQSLLEMQTLLTGGPISEQKLKTWKASLPNRFQFEYLFGSLQSDGTLKDGLLLQFQAGQYKYIPDAFIWAHEFMAAEAERYLTEDGSNLEARHNAQQTLNIVERMTCRMNTIRGVSNSGSQ